MEKSRRITVRIPVKDIKNLSEMAKERECNLSDAIRIAIRSYFEGKP